MYAALQESVAAVKVLRNPNIETSRAVSKHFGYFGYDCSSCVELAYSVRAAGNAGNAG